MANLKILSKARRTTFDGVPRLSPTDRNALMVQTTAVRKITRNFRSSENKVGFLVQRAYFQAKGRFHKKEQFRPADIRAAERSLGLPSPCNIGNYRDATAKAHQKIILDLHGWQPNTHTTQQTLKDRAYLHAKEQSVIP